MNFITFILHFITGILYFAFSYTQYIYLFWRVLHICEERLPFTGNINKDVCQHSSVANLGDSFLIYKEEMALCMVVFYMQKRYLIKLMSAVCLVNRTSIRTYPYLWRSGSIGGGKIKEFETPKHTTLEALLIIWRKIPAVLGLSLITLVY